MRLTIVGSGDAFGSGGRSNTCFRLETAQGAPARPLRRVGIGPLKARRAPPWTASTALFSRICMATISAPCRFCFSTHNSSRAANVRF